MACVPKTPYCSWEQVLVNRHHLANPVAEIDGNLRDGRRSVYISCCHPFENLTDLRLPLGHHVTGNIRPQGELCPCDSTVLSMRLES